MEKTEPPGLCGKWLTRPEMVAEEQERLSIPAKSNLMD